MPRRLAALLRGAGLTSTPEERLAWHLLHPYGDLPRDLAMCGLPPDAGLEAGVGIWRPPV